MITTLKVWICQVYLKRHWVMSENILRKFLSVSSPSHVQKWSSMYGFIWPESIWFLRETKRIGCGSRPCERSRRDKRRRGRGGRGTSYRRRRERRERKREPSRLSRRSESQQNNNNETLTASPWHWFELYVFVLSCVSGFVRRREKKRKERKNSSDRWLIHPNTYTLKDHFCSNPIVMALKKTNSMRLIRKMKAWI